MKRDHIALLQELAPSAPPCFASRSAWLEFLIAHANVGGVQGAVLRKRGEAVAFNMAVNYCEDCQQAYEFEMRAQGRCNPRFLVEQAKAVTP